MQGLRPKKISSGLEKRGYPYIVVSRRRPREFAEKKSVIVKQDKNGSVTAQKVINPESNEVLLYCHSEKREEKERSIHERFASKRGLSYPLFWRDKSLLQNGIIGCPDPSGLTRQDYFRVSRSISSLNACWSCRATGPGCPSLTRTPSSLTMGDISTVVPIIIISVAW